MSSPLLCILVAVALAAVQAPRPSAEKLGPDQYRIGEIRVDTAKREVSVRGFFNDAVDTLEFVANTRNGPKAYETLLTLETDAISFNAALLLIGLDPARGRAPKRQFDPETPQGDPVDVTVELLQPGNTRRFKIDELLFDTRSKTTIAAGPWVYTGSTLVNTTNGREYLAEVDGVLIGLMRGPQAIIENPRSDVVSGYGSIMLNPSLGIRKMSLATLTVKALSR